MSDSQTNYYTTTTTTTTIGDQRDDKGPQKTKTYHSNPHAQAVRAILRSALVSTEDANADLHQRLPFKMAVRTHCFCYRTDVIMI